MSERYQRVSDVEIAPMQDETILYHPTTQQFCVLNGTAAFLWERLGTPTTAEALAASVAEGFADADPSRVAEDVESALQQFRDLEFITMASTTE